MVVTRDATSNKTSQGNAVVNVLMVEEGDYVPMRDESGQMMTDDNGQVAYSQRQTYYSGALFFNGQNQDTGIKDALLKGTKVRVTGRTRAEAFKDKTTGADRASLNLTISDIEPRGHEAFARFFRAFSGSLPSKPSGLKVQSDSAPPPKASIE